MFNLWNYFIKLFDRYFLRHFFLAGKSFRFSVLALFKKEVFFESLFYGKLQGKK